MPIKLPECAGKPYRPSNGTEGEIFQEMFCYRCVHDEGDGCEIVLLSWLYKIDEPKYPKEWVFDKEGCPTCIKFKPAGTSRVRGD